MSRVEKQKKAAHGAATAPPVEEKPADQATQAVAPKVASSEEVTAPRRRTFTAEFKRQVLTEADACTQPGERGALLRRHALYSSHLTEWRRQRDDGALAGLGARKRGRKAAEVNPLAAENVRLERALKKALARAERAEGLVQVQKKLAELLGEELPPEDELLEAERLGLPLPPPRKKR